jgi:hypothetical protein
MKAGKLQLSEPVVQLLLDSLKTGDPVPASSDALYCGIAWAQAGDAGTVSPYIAANEMTKLRSHEWFSLSGFDFFFEPFPKALKDEDIAIVTCNKRGILQWRRLRDLPDLAVIEVQLYKK